MKRWHVLAPDAESAKNLYDDLVNAGIETTQIHVFAKDHAALKAAGLPEPTEMEEKMVTGQGVGRLISGLMGAAPSDPKIKEFESDIDAGRVLMVVIFPKERVDEIGKLIGKHEDAWSPEASKKH